jgi:hypothetical protein
VLETAPVALGDPADQRRSIQEGLARLEAEGAGAFDAPALDMVRNLLERARELEPEARVRLESRAAARLAELGDAYARERTRARAALESLAERESGGGKALAEAFEDLEGGHLDRVLRLARRRTSSGDSRTGRAEREQRAADQAWLYRDGLADLTASFSRAQSEDACAEQAGLLNGRRLAARLLEEADAISPAYRRALVASLVDLATLLHLPELPAPRRRR